MEKLFCVDGKVYNFLSKVVDSVFVTVLWIIGCLPVVTFLTSTSSMYHTVVKCIRYDRGNVFEDFKEAYKKNFRQGMGLTALYGCVGAVLGIVDYWVFTISTNRSGLFFVAAVGALIASVVYLLNVVWIVPVFSRFSNTIGNIIKLNYVISVKHLIRCIPVLLMIAVAVILVLASNELFFILPAVIALVSSYLTEPALWRYMPKQGEDNGDWRYGFQ